MEEQYADPDSGYTVRNIHCPNAFWGGDGWAPVYLSDLADLSYEEYVQRYQNACQKRYAVLLEEQKDRIAKGGIVVPMMNTYASASRSSTGYRAPPQPGYPRGGGGVPAPQSMATGYGAPMPGAPPVPMASYPYALPPRGPPPPPAGQPPTGVAYY